MTEFNLSEKIDNLFEIYYLDIITSVQEDVTDILREFIRLLKEPMQKRINYLLVDNSGEGINEAEALEDELNRIDKLSGDKLLKGASNDNPKQ